VLHRAFSDLQHCQQVMNRWRDEYNHYRPHEALDQRPPIDRYRPRPRSYPEQLPTIEYEPEGHVVKVRRTGQVYFKGLNVLVSGGLYGERVAIRPTTEDGGYHVVFIRKALRQIDLRQRAT